MKRYYVTDLDGTLLRSNATLSPYARQTLTAAVHGGAVIGYSTARSWQSSWPIVGSVPWNSPIVLYNGAMILDPVTRSVIGGKQLDAGTANALLELGRSHGLVPLVFALGKGDEELVYHEKLTRAGDLAFRASRPGDPRFRETASLRLSDADRTLMLTYIGSYAELEPLAKQAEAAFAGRAHLLLTRDRYLDAYFLEFSHPEANKREGLLEWCGIVGCEPAEVTVFGDQLNDIGLFEAAGRRIAVAGADTRLLALADHIAVSNDEDGVARYIAGQLLAERREGRGPS